MLPCLTFFVPCFSGILRSPADFIVDVLLGCASPEVREKASVLLFRLSQAHNESSKHSLTQVKCPPPQLLNFSLSNDYILGTKCNSK